MSPEPRASPRDNPRSFRNLAKLAGAYIITGTSFWVAVMYATRHDYGGVAFGICGGLFFALGCVLLTWRAVQGPDPQASASSARSDSEDDTLDNEKVHWDIDLLPYTLLSRLLPHSSGEVALDIEADPDSVVSLAKDILEEEGRLVDTDEVPGGWRVQGVIRAGRYNATPASVTISISERENHRTHVTIRGRSEDYLIRQHVGEKAAQRIAQQLAAQFPAAT